MQKEKKKKIIIEYKDRITYFSSTSDRRTSSSTPACSSIEETVEFSRCCNNLSVRYISAISSSSSSNCSNSSLTWYSCASLYKKNMQRNSSKLLVPNLWSTLRICESMQHEHWSIKSQNKHNKKKNRESRFFFHVLDNLYDRLVGIHLICTDAKPGKRRDYD